MRILVCGGRDFTDQSSLNAKLDELHAVFGITCVIHGNARGADILGGTWAIIHHIAVEKFPADWDVLGREAGKARNRQMLEEGKPDMCVACPGGYGTAHMTSLCQAAGVPVVHI